MEILVAMKTNNGGLLLDHHCLQLDGLNPPAARSGSLDGISVENSSKLLRLSHLKSTLRRNAKSFISHSEFVQICVDGCSSSDQGLEFAKMLDDSGAVIVLGNVLLRLEEVVVISISMAHPNDAGRKELEEMEKQKVEIDEKAEALVRREFWCGLGFLIVLIACLIWLTWKWSWGYMEPFFYFAGLIFVVLARYIFFLMTSKVLSLEGLFQIRFSTNQKSLMKKKNFDIEKFNDLQRALYPSSSERP